MISQTGNVHTILGHSDRTARPLERQPRSGDFQALLRDVNQDVDSPRTVVDSESTTHLSRASLSRGRVVTANQPAALASAEQTPTQQSPAARAPSGPGILDSQGATPRATASANSNGYVPTSDPRAPHLFRFAEVPDAAKSPFGPYRQAPPEFGGDWWRVTPFTGPEPWMSLDPANALTIAADEGKRLPEGFVEVFGPRPAVGESKDNIDYRVTLGRWEQDLANFHRTGVPDGFEPSQVEDAARTFDDWGMGRPVFYEGRYGWKVRFPDSAIPDFEMSAATAIGASHVGIAQYQVRLLLEGMAPAEPHPFVPPGLLKKAT